MTGAIVIRWGATVPGREAKALEVFAGAVARFEEMAESGRVHSHREFLALTGPESGFMIVDGEVSELMAIVAEDDTLKLNAQAAAVAQNFEIQVYGGGSDQSVNEMMTNYAGALAEIGYL